MMAITRAILANLVMSLLVAVHVADAAMRERNPQSDGEGHRPETRPLSLVGRADQRRAVEQPADAK